jgi:uncharacterized protein involved in exopolysaccharide biosynthesis
VEIVNARTSQPATTLRITYADRDAAQAQRIASQLTAAVAQSEFARATSAKVLEEPNFPESPSQPRYPIATAAGAALGLVAGGLIALVPRRRRS